MLLTINCNCSNLSVVTLFLNTCTIGQVRTFASLLYKDEMLSVRLSAVFFGTHVAPRFMHGSTPDLLDMKRPSLGNTEIF